jgi:hypothetical protein
MTKSRRKRKNKALWFVVLLWLGFLVFLVMVGRHFWRAPHEGAASRGGPKAGVQRTMLEQKLLNDHASTVFQVFGTYLVAASHEQRCQFVAHPVRIAPRMARYFELHPVIRIHPESVLPRTTEVLHLPGGEDCIEVAWASRDSLYETVFIRQNGEWLLDWEHFVRRSDYPLSLFLSGHGPEEAEFRLLVRERLAEERAHEPDLSLVFYAPVVGKPHETGAESPEILLPRDHPSGRRLSAAFDALAKGERPFGSRLAVEDSDDLVRVRVRLRRIQDGEHRSFEVIDLPACHWYGITDAVGVTEKSEPPGG